MAIEEVKDVNIGEPERIIEIEPLTVPVPEVIPDPTRAPDEPVSQPLEPARTRSGP